MIHNITFVSVQGKFISESDIKGLKINYCNKMGWKWFYNQIYQQIKKNKLNEKLIYPTKDYLFRHDRGSFWMASYRIPQFIGKYMGKLLDSSSMFELANALPWAFPKKQIVLQDFMIPRNNINSFFSEVQSIVELWPVWLLPMRNIKQDQSIFAAPPTLKDNEHLCNLGAYGIPKGKYDFIPINKKLEKVLQEHNGRKVFYSHAFYDDKTFFEEIYDGTNYFNLKNKYDSATLFPDITDKIITKDGKL